ncbi:MAG: prohibitin family protein [Flavobacteriales bacterium]|nr:prohibitin family protein [Flavobacteriales bacterium]
MFILILGIILIIVFRVYQNSFPNPKVAQGVQITGIVFILVGISTSSIKQINPGEVGIKVLFGNVKQDILNSGLHFINPLLEVKKMDIKTQNYTMSGIHDEGETQGDDAIRVLSSDGLEVIIDLTVLYRVIPSEAPNILQKLGFDYTNKIVRPITRTKIRDNAVYYDAISLYSKKRDEFQIRIFESIEKDFKKRGLLLEQLLVRNITLPPSVKASIESKINAEQDAQKMQFVLQKEKQEAERKRVEAQGISDYQRIISTSLTPNQIKYEMIKAYKEMATSKNSKMIIMGDGNSPLILDAK